MSAREPRTGIRMPRRAIGAALTAALIAIVTGCTALGGAPVSVALSEVAGFPADAPIAEPLFDEQWRGEPVGWLAEDRSTITIVSYGSSACPYIATAIRVIDETTLEIELRQGPAQACTDDLAPRTHVLAAPEGWGEGEGPYTATVTRTLDAFGAADPTVSTIELWPWPEPATIAVQTVRGVPDDISLPPDALETGEPLAYWGPERQSLRVITWGSSSCPPPATSLALVDAAQLSLVFGPLPAGRVCTADFGPTTHVLGVPDGVGLGAVTLAVRFEEGDGSAQQTSIPISD